MSLWSCTSCSKTFTRKGDLTRHELLHTGIKPHVCETCGKGFAQNSGLKTHRNVHSKAKPYSCGIGTCTKAFGDPSSRARHRKETHRREGAYKCIIADCQTRIKRRSAFVAHLRKHGLDTNLLDLDAIVLQSSERRVPAPTHFASPIVGNEPGVGCTSSTPLFFPSESSGYYTTDCDETTHSVDEWLGDYPLDFRQVNLAPTNNTIPLMLDQTTSVCAGIPHDVCPYLPNCFGDPFYLDGVFPSGIDYQLEALPTASPLNLPVLGPFLGTGVDGYSLSSTSSSPSSTYSSLYTSDMNDDVVSLSLMNNTSQESLLYNIM